jgi:hypothetical protein
VTLAIDVPRLYRPGVVNVWVEDGVVAAYLNELWSDPSVHSLIAGGKEGVSSLADHALTNRYPGVFGIVDRDFDETNYASWADPTKEFRRFVLPAHEFENYLLDADAIAGSDINMHGKTVAEIRRRLENLASRLVWWMACRAVVASLRRTVLDQFIPHPRNTDVVDMPSAERWIASSEWWNNIGARITTAIDAAALKRMLQTHHDAYRDDLANGNWLRTFSGKELFRDVTSYVYTPPQPASKSERDADVAKSIAKLQTDYGRRPSELLELLQSMKRKAGI